MKHPRRNRESGVAIYITTVMLTMIVPTIGLTIDGSMLYAVKCGMQGAADGAALAALRGLARGASGQQTVNAQNDAATWVKLNYPTSYFFSSDITVNPSTDVVVDLSVAQRRTVTVNAHVTAPTLFMRWLGFSSTIVNASATATRRDVNIALVVDRSGSLAASGSCEAVKAAASNFVNKFADGRDYISLVTFASSTHADFPIAQNFKTAATPVSTMLGNITCAGSTSSAMALWTGYDQLVGLGQAGALNIMLFFTDGKPTGVNMNMAVKNSPASPCTNAHPATALVPYRTINGLYNTYTNQSTFFGILNPTNSGTVTNGDFNPTPDASTGANCNYMAGGWSTSVQDTSDFLGLPQTDIYGDSLNNGYQSVTTTGTCPGVQCFIDLSNQNNAAAMAMNAADSAGTSIRHGAAEATVLPHGGSSLGGVIIYSLGLGNAPYPLSPDQLKRISNDPSSPIYDTAYPAGLFVSAPTTADIDAAFTKIASEIFRLAK